jgi:hypothetical protein
LCKFSIFVKRLLWRQTDRLSTTYLPTYIPNQPSN